MCPPLEKVKSKGAPKNPLIKQQKSTKRDLSYWEYIDVLHFVQNSNSSVKRNASSFEQPIQRQNIRMLDQFHMCIQDSIENIIDVKADGNCGYRGIAAVATYPSIGGRQQTHGCVFQERKMREVATNIYSRKTSEKLEKVWSTNFKCERFGSCIYARGRY